MSSSYRLVDYFVFDLAWFSSLYSKHLCVFSLNGAVYMYIKICFAYILLFTF